MKIWTLAAGLFTGIVIVSVILHRKHRSIALRSEKRYLVDELLTADEM